MNGRRERTGGRSELSRSRQAEQTHLVCLSTKRRSGWL